MPVRAIFFDAGDTLLHRWVMKTERYPWLCRQAAISLPEDPALLRAGAIAYERFFQDRRKHTDTWSRAWWTRLNRSGLAAMGVTGDLDAQANRIGDIMAALPAAHLVDPEAVPLLELLRTQGYRLAVVSNWDGTLVDTLRQTPLAGYFDAVLDSDVIKSAKPDTRIFDIACAATGVQPAEAVHVGDSPGADVAGAQAAGIRPVLLDALNLYSGRFDDLPRFASIQRLSQLPDVLC
jgi:putative hydrolase of the HAD superfamily